MHTRSRHQNFSNFLRSFSNRGSKLLHRQKLTLNWVIWIGKLRACTSFRVLLTQNGVHTFQIFCTQIKTFFVLRPKRPKRWHLPNLLPPNTDSLQMFLGEFWQAVFSLQQCVSCHNQPPRVPLCPLQHVS